MNKELSEKGKLGEAFWSQLEMPATIRSTFGKDLRTYGNRLTDVAKSGKIAEASLKGMNNQLEESGKEAIDSSGYFETFTTGIKNGLKTFASSALSMAGNALFNLGASALTQFVISGVSDWIHQDEIAIQKGQEAQSTINDSYKTFENGKTTINTLGQSFVQAGTQINGTSDAINSVATEYTRLLRGVDSRTNENKFLSDDDYQTYLNLSSQLATLYPQLQSETDAQGNAILNLGSNAKDAAKSIQQLYDAQMLSSHISIGSELQNQFKGVSTQVAEYQKQAKQYNKDAKEARKEADIASQNMANVLTLDIGKMVNESAGSITLDQSQLGKAGEKIQTKLEDALIKNGITYDVALGENNDGTTTRTYNFLNATEDQLKNLQNDLSTLPQETINKLNLAANQAEQKSASTTALIKDQWKGMTDSLGQYLQTTDTFDKLDSNLQNSLISNLSNLDIASLSKEYDGDALQFMYDKFITPLSSLSKDQQEALSNVLNIDEAKSTASDYVEQVNSAFERIFPNDKDLQEQWKKNFGLQNVIDENQKEIDNLADKFKDAKSKITDSDIEKLTNGDREIAYDLIINEGESFDTFDKLQKRIEETKQSLSKKDLSLNAMQQTVTDTVSNLSTLQSATSENTSSTGLTAETITSLGNMFNDVKENVKGIDTSILFKNTANGVKLNSKALSNMLSIQHQIKSEDFAKSINEQRDAIIDQNKAVQSAKNAWKSGVTAERDTLDKQEDSLKSMLSDFSALQQAQSQYHALYKQQQELFSDYGQWQQAQSTANAGDKYNNMVSGLKTAKEAWDKGLVGTDDFKSFAKLISPSGATDDVNFAENYAKAARYLTEDESGVKAFLNDLSSKGLADFNEESQQWSYNVKDMAEAAKQMGMGKDFMSNMFGRLEDYGFHNNVISDAEDGVLKLSDAYSNLAESEARLEDLKKNDPTNTTAIEQAEKEVSGYKQDVDELGTNLKEVASHTAENYNRELETAKNQMKTLADERERILKSNEYGDNTQAVADYMQSQIDQLGQSYGIDSSVLQQQAEQAAKAYSDALQNATIENPVTPDFGEDTASADAYASAVDKVQQANKNNNQTLSDSIKTLQEYNSEQIKGIDIFDGAYDSDELKPAEQALDNICQSLGLTSEEAGLLGQVLESMGIIKPEVDDSEVKQAKTDAEETKQTYDNLGDSTVSINADVSGEDSVTSFIDQCSSIQQGMSTTITATVSGESEVESLESGLEQIPDNTPTTVDVTVNNQQDLDNIQSKVDSLNAGGKDITLNAHIKPDSNSEVEVKAKDTTVKVTPDPKEVEVTAKPVKVDVQPSQKEVSVSAKVTNKPNATSQGTINYKKGSVEKANGTTSQGIINYKKGDVEKADGTVSTGVINYDLGNVATPTGMVATGTINYNLGTVAKPKAIGTMTSIAHVSGTLGARAYAQGSLSDFFFSPTPAHASGDVALEQNETALVNEVGIESIVRDGRWSLLPGGAHFVNLKKGDIIFSASQTEDLLKRGATPGHARAYAQGSLSDISLSNAFGGGSGWGGFGGGLSSKSSSSTSSSSTPANTSAQQANTKATNDNTKATKKNTSAFDFVARRLTYLGNKTKAIADKITNYVSSAFKTIQLKNQISSIDKEIAANSRGAKVYLKKARSLGLDVKTRRAIEQGKYSIPEYSTSSKSDGEKTKYDKIQEYAKYYDEYVKCTQAVQELKNQQLELFEQWANMPIEEAEKKIERLKNGFKGLTAIQAKLNVANLGGSAQAFLKQEMDKNFNTAKSNYNQAKSEQKSAKTRYSNASKNQQSAQKQASKDSSKLKSAKSKLRNAKGVTLTAEEKRRLNAGQNISTKRLKGKKKRLVQEYNKANTKSKASSRKLTTAKSKTKNAKSNLNTANAKYNTAKSAYDTYSKQYQEMTKYISSGDTLGYQNYLVDAEVSNKKAQNTENQKAYRNATTNRINIQKQRDAVDPKKVREKAKENAKKTGASILKNKKYSQKLTASQQKALRNGVKVSTKGIKDKKLLKMLNDYNNALDASEKKAKEYTAKYNQLSQELTIAQEKEAEAAANAAESEAEYVQAAIEAEQTKFSNISEYYDTRIENEKALAEKAEKARELASARGEYTKSQDYDSQILDLDRQKALQAEKAQKLQEQLDKSVKSGTIKEGSDEWLKMKTEILEAESAVDDFSTEIENLKQQQLTTKYEEMFDRAIDKADKFISKLNSIDDLISDDMKYDYETGELTEFGALSIALNAKELDSQIENIKKYTQKRQQIMDDFANGAYGEQKYDELMAENDSNLQSAIKNASNYRDAIVKIVTSQAQAVQDALFKVMDARKKAWQKKKEYYDYDKQLKNKTSEIQLLDQQIAALDGLTDAESKAMKAKLEAQRKEKQEDLDDTVRDHVYNLQIDGLDDLKDQLSEDFDKWSKELASNLDKTTEVINKAVSSVGNNTAQVMDALAQVLKAYGVEPSDVLTNSDLNKLDGYASGTKHVGGVPRLAMTNEKGREILVTKKGILTPVLPTDGVVPSDMTSTLMQMAMDYKGFKMPEVIMPNVEIVNKGESDGGNISIHYDSLLTVQGDVTKDALPDLKTILQKASEYTQNDIRKNRRRFG